MKFADLLKTAIFFNILKHKTMYNEDDFCPIVIAKGSIKKDKTDYISEAKAHGFTDKEIKDNYKEIVDYIDECNKNDYRPF